jgi:hypothetical protein
LSGDPILTLLIPGVLETLRMGRGEAGGADARPGRGVQLIEPMLAIMTE